MHQFAMSRATVYLAERRTVDRVIQRDEAILRSAESLHNVSHTRTSERDTVPPPYRIPHLLATLPLTFTSAFSVSE